MIGPDDMRGPGGITYASAEVSVDSLLSREVPLYEVSVHHTSTNPAHSLSSFSMC